MLLPIVSEVTNDRGDRNDGGDYMRTSLKQRVKHTEKTPLKAGSHIIAAIVSIAAVNSKSGLTIGTII